jgi:hypothetical protein
LQERSNVQVAWPLLGGLAILLADSSVSWDLRNANSNLIYVGLVMVGYSLLGALPVLAGAVVGISVSLKLYSGLVLLWLFLNGQRRAFFAGIMAASILWIVLPAVLFGPEGLVRVYEGWRDQLHMISDPTLHTRLASGDVGPPLVTLQRAIVNLSRWSFQSAATLGACPSNRKSRNRGE